MFFLSCMVYSSIAVVVSFHLLIYGIWYSFHSFIIGIIHRLFFLLLVALVGYRLCCGVPQFFFII